MENVKLTLSVPKNLVGPAKKYVSERHTSISKLFTDLISEKIKEYYGELEPVDEAFLEKIRKIPVSAEVKALRGILKGKLKDGEDYREAYREHILKKNGF